MNGNGLPAASGASATGASPAGPAAGYHTCVGSVRDGSAGRPAWAGVSRVGSTRVSERTPTAYGPRARNAAVVASAGQRANADDEAARARAMREPRMRSMMPSVLIRHRRGVQADRHAAAYLDGPAAAARCRPHD